MELFIYAVGISVVLLIAWIGYELYRIHEEMVFQARYDMIWPNGAPSQRQSPPDPHLFDQEQP